MTPENRKLLLAEISRQPMPLLAKTANICRKESARLPSRGQLYSFLHYTMTKRPDEMVTYLKTRSKRVANPAWVKITISGKKLSDYIAENIIGELNQLKELDNETKILGWSAGYFLYDNQLPTSFTLTDADRTTLTRLILVRFIEHLLLARENTAPIYNEKSGRLKIN